MVSPKLIDISGNKYGLITVLKYEGQYKRQSMFLCSCDCGKSIVLRKTYLISCKFPSCGCFLLEIVNKGNKRHGLSKTRIYRIWRCMLNRCEYKGHDKYKNYGAEGITVCPQWHSFEDFYNDMKEGYEAHLTLDRVDTKGNYEKENCQWASIQRQANNRSTNIYLEYDGQRHTVADWERKLGFSPSVIHQRRGYGWSIDKIFSTPQRKSPKRKNNVTI